MVMIPAFEVLKVDPGIGGDASRRIQDAINTAAMDAPLRSPVNRRCVFLPAGDYNCLTPILVPPLAEGLTLMGPGTASYQGGAHLYYQPGFHPGKPISPLLTVLGTPRFRMSGLHISAPPFQGELDLVSITGGPGGLLNLPIAEGVHIKDCIFGGTSRIQLVTDVPRSLLSLNGVRGVVVEDCTFYNAVVGIRGRAGTQPTDSVQIQGSTFYGFSRAAIARAGRCWTVSGCSFRPGEPGVAGAPGTVSPLSLGVAAAYASDDAVPAEALSFTGCYFGPVAKEGGTWVAVRSNGLSVNGCVFSSPDLGSGLVGKGICLRILDGSNGVGIMGNVFQGWNCLVFDQGLQPTSNVQVQGNLFSTSQISILGQVIGGSTITGWRALQRFAILANSKEAGSPSDLPAAIDPAP